MTGIKAAEEALELYRSLGQKDGEVEAARRSLSCSVW